jgi:hypothetical protein
MRNIPITRMRWTFTTALQLRSAKRSTAMASTEASVEETVRDASAHTYTLTQVCFNTSISYLVNFPQENHCSFVFVIISLHFSTATLYGNGTYFAKQSWYSCNDKYSNPDAQGLKYMYQARVLVGKPCLGTPGMVEPAPLDPNNPLSGLHDCAVNNVQKPTVYVVFSDAGAYPDYLISFKES